MKMRRPKLPHQIMISTRTLEKWRRAHNTSVSSLSKHWPSSPNTSDSTSHSTHACQRFSNVHEALRLPRACKKTSNVVRLPRQTRFWHVLTPQTWVISCACHEKITYILDHTSSSKKRSTQARTHLRKGSPRGQVLRQTSLENGNPRNFCIVRITKLVWWTAGDHFKPTPSLTPIITPSVNTLFGDVWGTFISLKQATNTISSPWAKAHRHHSPSFKTDRHVWRASETSSYFIRRDQASWLQEFWGGLQV